MALSRLIRKVASGDSVRFQEGEFDLNLTYITARIIGMGFPASGVEGMYRNSIVDVSQFLIERHNGNFQVYNLSSRPYDYTLFNNQVKEYGFPDHHNPPLMLLFTIVKSIHEWLMSDPAHVAVVHCLAGKGRTGTVIACYLIYCGMFRDPIESLDWYAERRSHTMKGVSRQSQKRYVQYFHDVCFSEERFRPKRKILQRIVFGPMAGLIANGLSNPTILIEKLNEIPTVETGVSGGINVVEEVLFNSLADPEVIDDKLAFDVNVEIFGDIIIRCNHITRLWHREVPIFRTSFHTGFIASDNRMHLTKLELDLADKDERVPEDFEVLVFFEDAKGEEDEKVIFEEEFFETAKQLRKKAENSGRWKEKETEDDFVLVSSYNFCEDHPVENSAFSGEDNEDSRNPLSD